ncbi:MAG: UPF0149 family protein [Alphaproteobacteria bacterium]|nr:UPF0149 family protein [Alphaproteobacteria bacterium]
MNPNDDVNEPLLIHSKLEQIYTSEGLRVEIWIYRFSHDVEWILEVVTPNGTSVVWDEPFKTDQEALDFALSAIQEDGIAIFITQAEADSDKDAFEFDRRFQSLPMAPDWIDAGQEIDRPLSEDELDELDDLLIDEANGDIYSISMLDGFCHALAIGPQTITPAQWLPMILEDEEPVEEPEFIDPQTLKRMVGLIMRHYNSVIACYTRPAPRPVLYFQLGQFDDEPFKDPVTWAIGFNKVIYLNQDAWQPLLDSAHGAKWFRPIGLLGQDDYSADQDELTQTPKQLGDLANQIALNLVKIHSFWLPLREAIYERSSAQAISTKVGRNAPCPCGSGKKFKKCCGTSLNLH